MTGVPTVPTIAADPAELLAAITNLIGQAGLDGSQTTPGDARQSPTLAAYMETVGAMLGRNTRRTWQTHWRRLSDGSATFAPSCTTAAPTPTADAHVTVRRVLPRQFKCRPGVTG